MIELNITTFPTLGIRSLGIQFVSVPTVGHSRIEAIEEIDTFEAAHQIRSP
jgi:hypothetical protein